MSMRSNVVAAALVMASPLVCPGQASAKPVVEPAAVVDVKDFPPPPPPPPPPHPHGPRW